MDTRNYEGEIKDMDDIENDAYDLLRTSVLTMDGCGIELNAMLKYLDGKDKNLKFIVLKHHAQGTAIWQPHDVAKCHGIFRKALINEISTLWRRGYVTTDQS